jgi:hypothetical protein
MESGHVWLNKLAILIVASALVFAVQLFFWFLGGENAVG